MEIKQKDGARGTDSQRLNVAVHDEDFIRWRAHARVDKFYAKDEFAALEKIANGDERSLSEILLQDFVPYETVETDGNLLTRLGRKRLMDRFLSTASNQGFDATHGRIGVGNASTAAVDTDTDLGAAAGAGNRQFVMVDSAPAVGSGASSGVGTFVATHTTGLSNFAWAEWGIDGGTTNGTTVTADTNTTPGLINHKIVSLGTKTSAAAWVFTATITLT